MITLHRLGHPTDPLHVNHDLIVSVEAHPDTVIHLTTGDRIVVAESPEDVARKVRECRIEILAGAMLCRDGEGLAPPTHTHVQAHLTRPGLAAIKPPSD